MNDITKPKNYWEELAWILENWEINNDDIESLISVIKNMIDDMLRIWIETPKIELDDENDLKEAIKSLWKDEILFLAETFRICWFNTTLIIQFIWQQIYANRHIKKTRIF